MCHVRTSWAAVPTQVLDEGDETYVYLKGLCQEINNFFKVLKIKSVLSVYAPIVFQVFCCLFMEKIKVKC